MKRRQSISDVLAKHLFWDMDYDALDPQLDMDVIIPRTLIASTPDTFLADIAKLERFYDKEQIVSILYNTPLPLSRVSQEGSPSHTAIYRLMDLIADSH